MPLGERQADLSSGSWATGDLNTCGHVGLAPTPLLWLWPVVAEDWASECCWWSTGNRRLLQRADHLISLLSHLLCAALSQANLVLSCLVSGFRSRLASLSPQLAAHSIRLERCENFVASQRRILVNSDWAFFLYLPLKAFSRNLWRGLKGGKEMVCEWRLSWSCTKSSSWKIDEES